jgi:hypothetical protein
MARKQPKAEIFDKIFELKWAEPFKPFTLTMADGQRFVIARWDTIGRSPNGQIIAFSPKGEGGFRRVPITQIVAVSPVRSAKTRSTRAKGSSPRSNGSSRGRTNR